MANELNISPDTINNILSMLKKSSSENVKVSSDTASFKDSNDAISNEHTAESDDNLENKQIDLNDILAKFSTLNNNSQTNPNNPNNSNNSNNSNTISNNPIDFDTFFKIKSIIDTLNTSNDPRSNLIYSLKPYLRKSKQLKLDQYVNLLKISQISNLFKNEQGDTK